MTNSINIIGLMSGTSVDGLDICYVSFDNHDPSKYEIIDYDTIDYDDNLKTKLKNIIKLDNDQIKQIDKEFGEFIGLSVLKFIKKNKSYKLDQKNYLKITLTEGTAVSLTESEVCLLAG